MATTTKRKSKKTAGKGRTKKTSSKKAAKAKTASARGSKKAAKTGGQKAKRMSALDAAATVLQRSSKPMRCAEMVDAMAEQGLWTSPGGKTPAATLYSAILRELRKGASSRFRKKQRGLFVFGGTGDA